MCHKIARSISILLVLRDPLSPATASGDAVGEAAGELFASCTGRALSIVQSGLIFIIPSITVFLMQVCEMSVDTVFHMNRNDCQIPVGSFEAIF